jgi:hypothetical protein
MNLFVFALKGGGLLGAFAKFIETAQDYLGLFATGSGLALLGFALYFGVTKLSSQHANHSWGKVFICAVVGGALFFGGLGFVLGIGKQGKESVSDFGIDSQNKVTITTKGAINGK